MHSLTWWALCFAQRNGSSYLLSITKGAVDFDKIGALSSSYLTILCSWDLDVTTIVSSRINLLGEHF